jgi:hypothetical protein
MEYHANVAVLRFASCASAEIVAFGVVTIRVPRHLVAITTCSHLWTIDQIYMDLREADDVETRLGPFGPVNITMKVALQEFLLNAFALFPCWYTFAMFSATLHRRPSRSLFSTR